MKLYYCEVDGGNFGDDLNPWLWPRLLPEVEFGDDDDGWTFVGIGTLLNDYHVARFPTLDEKLIFGTGAGLFRDGFRPVAPDPTWHVVAVRGPLTAELLGLPRDAAVTDPAALLADVAVEPTVPDAATLYVPHVSNAGPQWRSVCRRAGIAYLEPSAGVERVLAAIAASDLVLAEAMHAAMAADALRVPWIPIRSHGIDPFKWRDWCASLEMAYRPQRLPVLWNRPEEESWLAANYRDLKERLVVDRLRRLGDGRRRRLSDESVFRTRLDELRRRLDAVREAWSRGEIGGNVPVGRSRSHSSYGERLRGTKL